MISKRSMSIKNKKVLVIGAGGFVGRQLVTRLQKSGAKVTAVVRRRKINIVGVTVVRGDLSSVAFCQRIVTGADVVYYLAAAKKNIAHHTAAPFDFFYDNVEPLLVFFNAARQAKLKKLIYLSSTIVDYIADQKQLDGYVLGKHVNEFAVRAFAGQVVFPVTIIRPTVIYGPGDNFDPATANFLPAIITKVLAAKDQVEVWGRGVRRLQFIYVDDLADNLIAAAEAKGNFYVIGDHRAIQINEIVKKIIGISGKKLKIVHDTTKPDKPTQLVTFNNLVKPKTSFAKGLQATIEYYRKKYG